jgi:hypothetical protein
VSISFFVVFACPFCHICHFLLVYACCWCHIYISIHQSLLSFSHLPFFPPHILHLYCLCLYEGTYSSNDEEIYTLTICSSYAYVYIKKNINYKSITILNICSCCCCSSFKNDDVTFKASRLVAVITFS